MLRVSGLGLGFELYWSLRKGLHVMEDTVRAVDVADAILEQLSPGRKIDAEKFHSLLYVCQGVCLGVTGRVLFDESIEAWRDGPVVPDVHYLHRGVDFLSYGSLPEGSRKELDSASLRIVDYVIANYGLERGDFCSGGCVAVTLLGI